MTAIPDDALDREVLVRMTVRELVEWQSARSADPFDGVGTTDASEITGLDERKLRRKHRQWERESARGRRPAIRVSRKSASDRSDLLFDRTDCYTYRRDHGGGVRLSVEPLPPDDALDAEAEAIVDALRREG